MSRGAHETTYEIGHASLNKTQRARFEVGVALFERAFMPSNENVISLVGLFHRLKRLSRLSFNPNGGSDRREGSMTITLSEFAPFHGKMCVTFRRTGKERA